MGALACEKEQFGKINARWVELEGVGLIEKLTSN